MPLARIKGLERQELADEVLVYDLDRHRAHALNPIAALVWRHCDGETTMGEMSRILVDEMDIPADQELVGFVLARLKQAHLLEEDTSVPAGLYSRREFAGKLKRIGLAASFLVPLVTSIVAPTPGHAQTCVPNTSCAGVPNCTPCDNAGGNCEGNWRCCNGQCLPPGVAQQQCGC